MSGQSDMMTLGHIIEMLSRFKERYGDIPAVISAKDGHFYPLLSLFAGVVHDMKVAVLYAEESLDMPKVKAPLNFEAKVQQLLRQQGTTKTLKNMTVNEYIRESGSPDGHTIN